MSGLTRSDELKLTSLRQRKELGDEMTETELLQLSVLEDRYNRFLEEGMKALRATPPTSESSAGPLGSLLGFVGSRRRGLSLRGDRKPRPKDDSPTTPASSPAVEPNGSFSSNDAGVSAARVVHGARDDESRAAPLTDSTQRLCGHWSWVADYLVVGAVPLATGSQTDPSAHLFGLLEQCKHRGREIGLVVSALDIDESSHDDLREFAGPRDWAVVMNVSSFVSVALPESRAEEIRTPIADMSAVCAQIHATCLEADKTVYVHCKAGGGRSWVVVMCYLISHRHMTTDEAANLLAVLRPGMQPSPAQRRYVTSFGNHISSPSETVMTSRSRHEEIYCKALADILSLPPEFRERLQRDLEQLT